MGKSGKPTVVIAELLALQTVTASAIVEPITAVVYEDEIAKATATIGYSF